MNFEVVKRVEEIEKKISKDIKDILKKLNDNGKGYIVGGYLRDLYLGYNPKDCDFATDISYEKLKNIFKEYGVKEIGRAFGIVQIFYNEKYYEIAKLRKELEFSQRRNKVEIDFVNDIYEDLKRRDLTINSLAYDGERVYFLSEEVREDLKNRVARFIGEPGRRVEEDPLRILRILRIAYEKKLKIEKNSYEALKKYKKLLKRLSIERIQEELFKILRCEKAGDKILELYRIGVINQIFKEYKLKEQQIVFLNSFPDVLKKKIAFFMFNEKSLKDLKLSNKEERLIKTVLNIIENNENIKSKIEIKKILKNVDIELLKISLSFFEPRKKVYLERLLDDIINNKEPYKLKHLSVKGGDIKEIIESKKIGESLEKLLDIVIENPELNRKNILLKLLEE